MPSATMHGVIESINTAGADPGNLKGGRNVLSPNYLPRRLGTAALH